MRADARHCLEAAIDYAVGSLDLVRVESLSWPTPCAGWDLRRLLEHLAQSMRTTSGLLEGKRAGGWRSPQPVLDVRIQAAGLRNAVDRATAPLVIIEGFPIPAAIVLGTAAFEIAVHGWDVVEACRTSNPVPADLATELLRLAPEVIDVGDRADLFRPPVPAMAEAAPGDRLVAFAGRRPLTTR
jgi:uncharacterized protein (TIGR03086 family)